MNANDFAAINTMIQQDLATSRQLLALLEKETESTQNRDYQALAQLLEEKVPLLDQLKKNAHTRSEWLSSLGKSNPQQEWLQLLSNADNQSLSQQWQEIQSTIEHCQHINSINGKLISRGAKAHSRLLDIMRGNLHQANVYNAKGIKYSTALSGKVTQA